MFKYLRLALLQALLMTFVGLGAAETKSFSKQMNEIKRSGEYVYAESSAPAEADAKAACDALLKIEITKFLSEKEQGADARIVKDISSYNREYLVQPRGDMTRVFGYVAKKSIVSSAGKQKEKKQEAPAPAVEPEQSVETAAEPAVEPAAEPVAEPAEAPGELVTGTLQLSAWQKTMLETIVAASDMAEAKKLLNRYRYQNRIKRLGDDTVRNPRPTDSYYLVFDADGNRAALLAPAMGSEHLDMLTGSPKSLDDWAGRRYLWFQISK